LERIPRPDCEYGQKLVPKECRALYGLPTATAIAGEFSVVAACRRTGFNTAPREYRVSTSRKSQVLMIFGGAAIVFLLAAVFTLGSLNLPIQPSDSVILYALSTFLAAALIVFAFILGRSLVRLGAERLAHKPGSRFKTKMVLGAIAVSFLPVVVLFFVSYALLNRTLVRGKLRPPKRRTRRETRSIRLTSLSNVELTWHGRQMRGGSPWPWVSTRISSSIRMGPQPPIHRLNCRRWCK
jgi:hypothetical protein